MKRAKKELIQSPKGMHDILSDVVPYYDKVCREARRVAEYYGFETIRTPHVEKQELFLRPLGETSDVVEKQMYTFRTRGGDQLVLRPEGTASMMRAYLEAGMQSKPQPVKLFYDGAFFRHENPQGGRWREFHQAGVEILGEGDAVNDALVIRILESVFESIHINNITIHINSIGCKTCRMSYKKELVGYYRKKQNSLCKDCRRRLKENPMRLLDCKDVQCKEPKSDAPQIIDYLCDECKNHFKEVLEYLDEASLPYFLDHYLVRGFDYYTRTVFEIFSTWQNPENSEKDKKEEINVALGGGGRYDGLAELLGAKNIPGVGGAIGVDRVVEEMRRRGLKVKAATEPKIYLIQLGKEARKKMLVIAEDLRKNGIPFTHSFTKNDLKRQLRDASRIKVPYVLIVGQREALDGNAILREMNTSSQELIPIQKLIGTIKMRLK